MANLDLQDAYFLVAMHKENTKFLRFIFEELELFEFAVRFIDGTMGFYENNETCGEFFMGKKLDFCSLFGRYFMRSSRARVLCN